MSGQPGGCGWEGERKIIIWEYKRSGVRVVIAPLAGFLGLWGPSGLVAEGTTAWQQQGVMEEEDSREDSTCPYQVTSLKACFVVLYLCLR